MTESNAYWQTVVDALRHRGFQFRVKWSGDDDMTAWQPWVICPVLGYLEAGSLGPVPVREVEWLDIALLDRDGTDKSESITNALLTVGITSSQTTDSIRVGPHVA